jgi:isopenicillin N synthase-like dioxygenase
MWISQYQPGVISRLQGFDLARELSPSFVEPGSSLGPNVWPTEIPGFQEDIYGLYNQTTTVSHMLFRSFAEMLGLPADTFLVRP